MANKPLVLQAQLQKLALQLEGELHLDRMTRLLYATDASVYRELPLAVAYPKNESDIRKLVLFCREHHSSIIPRAAGTSLAGQCVGDGIVVDISHYMNQILEVNKEESWVRVQPGVVRDELNHFLKPHHLFFGPNTSTANRATIGGMIGNNSCGSYSIVYGTTREHTLEVKAILSDGSQVLFKSVTKADFEKKAEKVDQLEGRLYKQLKVKLSDPEVQQQIKTGFPKASIHRRNTGYAVDALLASNVFEPGAPDLNLCQLICGSEGTLAFITEVKIHVDPLPPSEKALLCVHFKSVDEALRAVPLTLKHEVRAVELMDKIVLDCTKDNAEQKKNRFFIEGDPEAILIIEFGDENKAIVDQKANDLIKDLKSQNYGYHFPMVYPPLLKNVWQLRKAGLGVLANIPGDEKAVTVIEDTAVDVEELADYIQEVSQIMAKHDQRCVYYAHAGAGELHLRPILNLKSKNDVRIFRQIGEDSAHLIRKYRGSLSGEHGDGRVRAEFLPLVMGAENYQLLREIKQAWDPLNIFNPGKIVDAPPMDEQLRYEPDQATEQFDTLFDFSATGGLLRAAEKCNGSGDCRKTHLSGGTMCPSFMATRKEKDTTRARANILREFLTRSPEKNRFNHPEIKEVMDLCLSCKGCATECPSNVDMATMKAEFLYQYYRSNGVPLRASLIANIANVNAVASFAPWLNNFFLSNPIASKPIKKLLGIAHERSLPTLAKTTLKRWFKKHHMSLAPAHPSKGKVYLFADEFTNYNDVEIGVKAILLLTRLGYEVEIPKHDQSGRAYFSKGLLKEAQRVARNNIKTLKGVISAETPLLGIEPSAILSFRDEYPKLVGEDWRPLAERIGENCLLFSEFINKEIEKGKINSASFTKRKRKILLHGHCHQKALSDISHTAFMLSLPENYSVEVIPSGCCGMAGSFGYEKEHYDISMQIGELVLFPAVRNANAETIVAAPGTSCRHQIADGTSKKALHPAAILFDALR